jgi:hypothetical protein
MPFERRITERRIADRRKKQIPWPLADRRRRTVRLSADRRLNPPAERGSLNSAHSSQS